MSIASRICGSLHRMRSSSTTRWPTCGCAESRHQGAVFRVNREDDARLAPARGDKWLAAEQCACLNFADLRGVISRVSVWPVVGCVEVPMEVLQYCRIDSPVGPLMLAASERALVLLQFGDHP